MKSRNELYLSDSYSDHAILQHEVATRLVNYLPEDWFTDSRAMECIDLFSNDSYLTNGLKSRFPHLPVIQKHDQDSLKNHPADLIVSNLALQDQMDLQSVLLDCQATLKPNGKLLFSCLGSESFKEVSNHQLQINTFPEMKALGDLLHQLGFINVVMYKEQIKLTYVTLETLLEDLRITGIKPFEPFSGLRTVNWLNQWKDHMKQTLFDVKDHCYIVEAEILYGMMQKSETNAKKEPVFSVSEMKALLADKTKLND